MSRATLSIEGTNNLVRWYEAVLSYEEVLSFSNQVLK